MTTNNISLVQRLAICVGTVWIVVLLGGLLVHFLGFFGFLLTVFSCIGAVAALLWHYNT